MASPHHSPASLPNDAFAGTAAYYARYRPRYPADLYDYLTARFGLDGTQTTLDLGSGPGIIALPLSRLVAHVYAVDPDADMLTEGRAATEATRTTNITWVRGRDADLPGLGLPALHLTTIGKAFHWMDRRQTLTDLDALTAPGGGVALISPHAYPDVFIPSRWRPVIDEVRIRYLGPDRRAGNGLYPTTGRRHEELLATSPFNHVETVTWTQTVTRTLDEMVGLQLSQAYTSPALLGPHQDAYEHDLREALTELQPDGVFTQDLPTTAIIATRAHEEP
ncbi:class I SAM-dependent methyltransferase [Actinomadura oligospora]|uniref:class I SAM-dependent methyltransferase n=1 Tax=Actinomadura oligospora TaxID=111804 RepID=UPI00047C8625|nr:class I SAM-dependent methyltransferase [Actinomadura oligospora]